MSQPCFAPFLRVAAAALTIAALSLGGAADLRAAEPVKGGSLSISLEADLPSLDPLQFASFNDREAGILVYDTLLDIDSKGNIVPNIAEKLDAAPDAMSFRIALHKDVKFHDGTPLDAAAVVKHFQRLMDPKNRCRCLSDLSTIDTIEATGPLEVSFRMKTPSAHFPGALANVSGMVVSPVAAEKWGADYGAHPVGAGPFVFKEWQRGAQVTFTRNDNYWKKPAYLDQVVLRPMPDEQTRYASLKAGNLDIVMNAAARDIIDARAGKFASELNPGSLATVFLMINVSQPDVSDIRVRQAMAHALDRVALNKAVNRGLYKIANTPFGSGLSPHEQVDGYPGYDLPRAKKLLADYGKPVKLKFSIGATPIAVLAAQAIQQMWKKAGIESEIQHYEGVQFIRTAAASDFQVMLYRWAGGPDPDNNVHQFFHSKGSVNRTKYLNPEMDRLLDSARSTTDPAARLRDYRQINNILARDLPYIFLTYFDNISLTSRKVHGLVAVPDGLLRLQTVWKDK